MRRHNYHYWSEPIPYSSWFSRKPHSNGFDEFCDVVRNALKDPYLSAYRLLWYSKDDGQGRITAVVRRDEDMSGAIWHWLRYVDWRRLLYAKLEWTLEWDDERMARGHYMDWWA